MSRMESTKGLSPELIGQVVSVTVVPKNKAGETFPNKAERHVGKLKSYFRSDQGNSGSFVIDGYPPRHYGTSESLVTVYTLAEN